MTYMYAYLYGNLEAWNGYTCPSETSYYGTGSMIRYLAWVPLVRYPRSEYIGQWLKLLHTLSTMVRAENNLDIYQPEFPS